VPEPIASPAGAEHEAPGVATRSILLIGAGLMATLLVSLGAIALAFLWRQGHLPLGAAPPRAAASFPAPRLQVAPGAELAAVRAAEDAKLGPEAAMPIEAAMRAIARRGAAAYAPLTPQAKEKAP
jgi:hypothetical protein